MIYRILTDITIVCHLLWILFLIFGALFGRRILWVRLLHLSSLGYSILLQLNHWLCPLTHLEIWLRSKTGSGYSGSFIQHYVEKLVYLDVSREAVFIGTAVVIVGTGVIYLWFRKK